MELHHLVEGSGPAVLLLHAGVADLRMWDGLSAALRSDHLVVRCDLRGFGGTPLAPGADYSDAEDVIALLDELGIESCAVVGASYGGHVAVQVAATVPERVNRLVLLAPAGELVEPDDGLRALWREEGALVEAGDLEGATDLNVRSWLGPAADADARERLRVMQRVALEKQVAAGDVAARDLPVRLERLTMPTLVVVGGHDRPFFVGNAQALAERLPDARLVELPWAGHLPSLERPAEADGLVREALSA